MNNINIEKSLHVILCNQRQCWEQALSSQVLLALNKSELVRGFARDSLIRQLKDGRPGMVETEIASADTAGFGELLEHMSKENENYVTARNLLVNYLMVDAPRTDDGILYHLTDRKQIWADALYFLPTGLAALGYYDEAIKQFNGIHRRLWNDNKKMYSHIWDEESGSYFREAIWASGNGWAAAGIAKLLKQIPEQYSEDKLRLAALLTELLDSICIHQHSDGLFHDIIDDYSSFIETNSAQMIAYAIYTGAMEGIVSDDLIEKAKKMQAAANDKMDRFGVITGACSSPYFDKPGSSTEAQCFYIMMEIASRSLN